MGTSESGTNRRYDGRHRRPRNLSGEVISIVGLVNLNCRSRWYRISSPRYIMRNIWRFICRTTHNWVYATLIVVHFRLIEIENHCVPCVRNDFSNMQAKFVERITELLRSKFQNLRCLFYKIQAFYISLWIKYFIALNCRHLFFTVCMHRVSQFRVFRDLK